MTSPHALVGGNCHSNFLQSTLRRELFCCDLAKSLSTHAHEDLKPGTGNEEAPRLAGPYIFVPLEGLEPPSQRFDHTELARNPRKFSVVC